MIPPTDKTGSLKAERRRDNQQWLLDWMVKTTGRTHNFAYDHREIPPEVKTYRQIPRVLEKLARHQETIGRAAEAAGHPQSACEMYHMAAMNYRIAQHAIFYDDHPDKIHLHGKLIECFEGIMRTADYPIERVEIDWEWRPDPGQLPQGARRQECTDGPVHPRHGSDEGGLAGSEQQCFRPPRHERSGGRRPRPGHEQHAQDPGHRRQPRASHQRLRQIGSPSGRRWTRPGSA